jgi:hypothetical protein
MTDGLPLALDQAGAYIEEAQVSPGEYLKLYRREGGKLRAKPGATPDHDSVTRTFSLAVERLGERAKDIIRMCAFMAPDAIPEEILTAGEEPDLAFREAVAEAAKYSLISRNAVESSLEIHRLVQDVVRDGLDDGLDRAESFVWAESSSRSARCSHTLSSRNGPSASGCCHKPRPPPNSSRSTASSRLRRLVF